MVLLAHLAHADQIDQGAYFLLHTVKPDQLVQPVHQLFHALCLKGGKCRARGSLFIHLNKLLLLCRLLLLLLLTL